MEQLTLNYGNDGCVYPCVRKKREHCLTKREINEKKQKTQKGMLCVLQKAESYEYFTLTVNSPPQGRPKKMWPKTVTPQNLKVAAEAAFLQKNFKITPSQ